MIYDTFENEKYISEMLKLNKAERIIIAFNIILEMELSEISYLLDTSIESTYTKRDSVKTLEGGAFKRFVKTVLRRAAPAALRNRVIVILSKGVFC